MDAQRAPMDPDEAGRRFAARVEEAGLPRFARTLHDPANHYLEVTWENGYTIHLDLTYPEIEPLEDWERDAILGRVPSWAGAGPIDVYVPGSADGTRTDTTIPGVAIHRGRRCTRTTSPPSTATRSRHRRGR